MMDIGQLLRHTRESQEVSLAEAEERTRIRRRYLAALEAGEWEELPNTVVGRGFLRTYTRFLGLNEQDVLAQLDNAVPPPPSTGPAPVAPAEPAPYQPIDLDFENIGSRKQRNMRRLLRAVAIVLVVAVIAFLIVRYVVPPLLSQDGNSGAGTTAQATLPPTGAAPATPLIIVGASPTPTETPTSPPATATTLLGRTPTATPTLTATPVQQLTLRVRTTQRAWVQVAADGAEQIASVAEPGYEGNFVAGQQLVFRTGNAGGVELTLNGAAVPPLGETGQIVEITWTLENGAVKGGEPAVLYVVTRTPTLVTTPGVETTATGAETTAIPTATPGP